MKSDVLFDAIGELPDEYVQDARPATVLKRKVPWGVWAAAAACLVVAVLIAVPLLDDGANSADATRSTVMTSEIVEESEAMTTGAGAPATEEKNAEDEDFNDEPDLTESNELPAGALTEEKFEEYNLALYSGVYGGTYTYEEYLIDYENVTKNPVFDALLNGDGTDRFFAVNVSAYMASPSSDAQTQNATVYLNGILAPPTVQITHDGVYSEQDDEPFDRAAAAGTRRDYEIDGFEIQKYFGSDTYWARIMIDGDWYLVYGVDEAAVDETMAELARIANEL